MRCSRVRFAVVVFGVLLAIGVGPIHVDALGLTDGPPTPAFQTVEAIINETLFPQEPEIRVEGSAGVFSGFYHPLPGGSGGGTVELRWNHSGESLQWRSGASWDPDLPPTLDFVYMLSEFEWTEKNTPTLMYLTVDLAVTVDGDFSTEPGRSMFNVRMWLAGPSGDWVLIGRAYPPDIDNGRFGGYAFSSEISVAFDNTPAARGEGGPDSPAKIDVIVGLTPDPDFRENETSWDGSVSVEITRIYGEAEYVVSEPPFTLGPTIHPTWSTKWGAFQLTARSIGMAEADDRGLYVASQGVTEDSEPTVFLLKYGSSLALEWNRTLATGDSRFLAISSYSGTANVLGIIHDPVANKSILRLWRYAPDGTLAGGWDYDLGALAYCEVAAALPDGGFVVGVMRDVGRESLWTVERLSSDGSLVWSVQTEEPVLSLIAGPDGSVYASAGFALYRISPSGELDWSRSIQVRSAACRPDGNVIVVRDDGGAIRLSLLSPAGELVVNSTISFGGGEILDGSAGAYVVGMSGDDNGVTRAVLGVATGNGTKCLMSRLSTNLLPVDNITLGLSVENPRWATVNSLLSGDVAYIAYFAELGDGRLGLVVDRFSTSPVSPANIAPMVALGVGLSVFVVAAAETVRRERERNR